MSDDLLKKIVAIVVDKLDADENKVTEDAKFIDDLGADSLDTVELIMQFEEDFGLDIPFYFVIIERLLDPVYSRF